MMMLLHCWGVSFHVFSSLLTFIDVMMMFLYWFYHGFTMFSMARFTGGPCVAPVGSAADIRSPPSDHPHFIHLVITSVVEDNPGGWEWRNVIECIYYLDEQISSYRCRTMLIFYNFLYGSGWSNQSGWSSLMRGPIKQFRPVNLTSVV
jgi:hypothetical protein